MSRTRKQVPSKPQGQSADIKVESIDAIRQSDIFNFDRLFADAASFTKPGSGGKDIQYPRGSSLSKKSPIVKDLFANSH
jgi:hypothetical protein